MGERDARGDKGGACWDLRKPHGATGAPVAWAASCPRLRILLRSECARLRPAPHMRAVCSQGLEMVDGVVGPAGRSTVSGPQGATQRHFSFLPGKGVHLGIFDPKLHLW